jgi:ABC-2 type transport system permease protein
MMPVYQLTLRQLTGKWRLIIMGILAILPVIIVSLLVMDDRAATIREFEVGILGAMLAGTIAPLVVLAIGGPAFGNELEDRTLANLTLTPIPRWKIAVPKLLATITVAAPFTLVSALATSWIAYLGDPTAVFAVTTGALVGVALYASLFVWLGLMSTQAIGLGLLYIVLWEGFFGGFVAGVRLLSIRQYSIALMHGLDPRRFAYVEGQLSLPVVSVLCAAVFAGFLMMSVRRLRSMDIP